MQVKSSCLFKINLDSYDGVGLLSYNSFFVKVNLFTHHQNCVLVKKVADALKLHFHGDASLFCSAKIFIPSKAGEYPSGNLLAISL